MILIAALLPASAIAHDWNQEYWLERMTRNHIKIGDCFQAAVGKYSDPITFRQSCSLHSMGYTENSVFAEYYTARLHHPLMSDVEFVMNHFNGYDIYYQGQILDNIQTIKTKASAAIATMHIVEGLTRNDK